MTFNPFFINGKTMVKNILCLNISVNKIVCFFSVNFMGHEKSYNQFT